MPVDDRLPPSRLSLRATPEQIAWHFPAACGGRVDLDNLPPAELPSLARARLPEPPEARLLDRVLQVVPPTLVTAAERMLIVDSGVVGREGGYRAGIIRLYSPVLHLSLSDPRYGSRFSLFTTTVLHELGHAVYAEPAEQRSRITNTYLTDFIAEESAGRSARTPCGHAQPPPLVVTSLTPLLPPRLDPVARAIASS